MECVLPHSNSCQAFPAFVGTAWAGLHSSAASGPTCAAASLSPWAPAQTLSAQNNTNYLNNHLMGLNSEADSIVAREFLTLEDALWWSGRLLSSLTFRMISKACMFIDAFAWRCWWWFIHLYWGHVEGAHSVETSQYVLILLLSLYTCQEL